MIARLTSALDFDVTLPEGETFKGYEYDDHGYRIRIFPPITTDVPLTGATPESLTINDQPAFMENGLRIDFVKESFDRDRNKQTPDPPNEIISSVVQYALYRLRYTSASDSS